MGVYVYTARATGRKYLPVDGGYHWVFPYEYAYKPWWQNPDWNERQERLADRQRFRVLDHPDWEGYVSIYGEIYKNADPLWWDTESPGELVQ